MKARHRRIIFYGFVLLFFITAPLLILYASGYRYNWDRQSIQTTGVLSLEYKPRDARISINGVRIGDTSPARIAGLLPGRYDIEIQRDGYSSWKKRLWIESGKTTFASQIHLWKAQPTPVLIPDTHTQGESWTIVDDNTIVLLHRFEPKPYFTISNLRTGVSKHIDIPVPFADLYQIEELWSPHHRRVLVSFIHEPGAPVPFIPGSPGEKLPEKHFVLSLENEVTLRDLSTISPDRILFPTWDPKSDDHFFAYTDTPVVKGVTEPALEYQLVEFDLYQGQRQQTTLRKLQKPVNSLATRIDDGVLNSIHADFDGEKEDATLVMRELRDSARAVERRIPLPLPDPSYFGDSPDETSPSYFLFNDYHFLPNGPDLTLTLLNRNTLLLIDRETRSLFPIEDTIEHVGQAVWSPQKNKLLWSSGSDYRNAGSDLMVLDLEQSSKTKIATLPSPITGIAWHPDGSTVFASTVTGLYAIELDGRDARNVQTLLEGTFTVDTFSVNQAGDTIFFAGASTEPASTFGLHTLTITE